MQIPEITTAMATAAWVDLVIDPKLLAVTNAPRNRRALFLVALIAGSFAGAFMRSRIGSPLALVVSGIGKALVATANLVNRRQPDEQDETLAVLDSPAIFKRTLSIQDLGT
jgi:DNA-binding IclR family transcriptional regulator